MKLSIHGRQINLTDAIKKYAEEKVLKLEKFNDYIIRIDVTLFAKKQKTGHSHTAEILAYLSGSTLKAEVKEQDLYVAIDKACDNLEVQLKKHKEKHSRAKTQKDVVRKNFQLHKPELEIEEKLEAEKETKKIVKVYLPMKPMEVEEAVLQLESLDKLFFAFTNIETDKMTVVYKRKDGDYGLIEE